MPKLLILREKRTIVDGRERVIIKGAKFFVEDITKDFHTKYGIIKAKDLQKKDGSIIKSAQDKEFILLTATFGDEWLRLKRLPQSMIRKDIGYIIAETAINKNSKVLDAGVGNASLTTALANLVKQVVAYEIDEKHLENAKKNIQKLKLTNITLKKGSIYEPIKEKNFDLVTLDVPEPWEALETANNAVKIGGYILCYSPSTIQVQKTVQKAKQLELLFTRTVELIERKWKIKGDSVRPDNIEIGHTGFLTFLRKIQ